MDPILNPFSPGAGSPPPELVGRDQILEQARILLGRVKRGRSEKSMLLTGLRGVGKTVLLNEIRHMAEDADYRTALVEAHESRSLALLIISEVRSILLALDRIEGAKDTIKRGFAVLRSFIGTLKVEISDLGFGLDIEPARGTADSGDLETDLPSVFVAVADAAKERTCGVAIFVDELQYFKREDLGALIMAMHRIQQRQLPLVLIGAGLPILPALAGESKSYSERLFSFPVVGALSKEDVDKALEEPAQAEGGTFAPDALDAIYRLTKGYPYFVQEWAYQSWNLAPPSTVTSQIVESATAIVVPRLDENFFRVRFDRLTPTEKRFLRAMADTGPDLRRTGDVAEKLRVKIAALGPMRDNLIKKGMIYSPAYGEVAFTVPRFDEFMRRTIPSFSE